MGSRAEPPRRWRRAADPARAGVRVDAWNATTGEHAGSVLTTGAAFNLPLPPGSYFLSTHNDAGIIDQVFDSIACLDGSAWEGRCDPTAGTPLVVNSASFPRAIFHLAQRTTATTGPVGVPATGMPATGDPATGVPATGVPATGMPASGTQTAGLRGRVTAPGGQPLSGIELLLYPIASFNPRSTITGANGRYRFDGVPANLYLLEARSRPGAAPYLEQVYNGIECAPTCEQFLDFDVRRGTPIPVAAQATITGLDFQLQPGGVLRGRVLDARGRRQPETRVSWRNADGSIVGSVSTDALGFYSTPPLPPGNYYLAARQPDFEAQVFDRIPCPLDEAQAGSPPSCTVTDGTPVRARAGATTDRVDFYLRPEAILYGFVYDAVNGQPLAFQRLLLMVNGQGYQITFSNRAGRYAFDSLPDRIFQLGTDLVDGQGQSPANYANALYDGLICTGPCDGAKGSPIATPASTQQRIDFQLPRRPLRLFGSIHNAASGAPLSEFELEVYHPNGTLAASTFTAEDGNYRFDLPPGPYYLRTRNSAGFVDQLYPDIECPDAESPDAESPDACDPTAGTLLVLDFETGQRADFALRSVLEP